MQPHPVPAWKRYPFLRIAPPFLLGISLEWNGLVPPEAAAWSFALFCLVHMAWLFLTPSARWTGKPLTGIAMHALLFATGITCAFLNDPRRTVSVGSLEEQGMVRLLRIEELQTSSSGRLRAIARSYAHPPARPEQQVPKKVALYFRADSGQALPESGDLITTHVRFSAIRNTGNPGEQDVRGWFATKGIFLQASVRAEDWMILNRRGPPFWTDLFDRTRRAITAVFQKHLNDSGAVSLAVTLLTGYRTAMDPDLLQAYANTGVVHVIAISGLHLGLIHLLLMGLLMPVFRRMGKPWLAGLVALPPLWLFSFFTGASASVIRSAVMFTGAATGASIGKRPSMLNGLSASAVLLLAVRPDWIADIGFQLSYSALLSIGVFQPLFRHWVRVTNPTAGMLRDLVSVTLAAQVLTAPLVAYHFHRLPLLFLFGNILAVPLSSLILLVELLLCACSGWQAIADILGTATTRLIRIMNEHVMGMDAIPHASWTGLRPNPLQVLLTYVTIACIHAWWKSRNTKSLNGAAATLCLVLGIQLVRDRQLDRQSAFIALQARYQSLYAIVEGRHMLVLSDPDTTGLNAQADKHLIDQAVAAYGTATPSRMTLLPGRDIRWKANGREWSLSCDSGATWVRRGDHNTVCLVLSRAYRGRSSSFPSLRQGLPLVADASVPLWKIQEWKSSPEGVPSRFHSVPEQGAFLTEKE
jgi:competence protein ComEC